MLLGCYMPIGGGIMLLCQIALAIPCTLIVVGLLATSARRRRHPKYWFALACSVQPLPLMLVLRAMGSFSPHFCTLWLISMGLGFIGFVGLVVWPNQSC